MTRFSSIFMGCVFLLVAIMGILTVSASSSLVLIRGRSMEPAYHDGDMVIAMKQPDYQVGEIVTYFNKSLGRYVIHRIVDKQGGYFILKGDNNDWIDGDRPTKGSILGKSLIHISRPDWLYTQFKVALSLPRTGFAADN